MADELVDASSSDKSFIPFKKERSAGFSTQVEIHHKLIESVTPIVLSLLDSIRPVLGQTFTIADYGTADGGTSYHLVQKAVGLLRRKHGDGFPIQVIYEDQPVNDFTPLFLRATGLLPGTSSLTEDFPNVFVLASGRSFYSQCMPVESLDFIVSFTSVHWMSKSPRIPCPSLFPSSTEGEAYVAFKEQAAVDWEKFLLFRAKELKLGGYLVVTTMSCSPDCRVKMSMEKTHRPVTQVWKSLYDDGVITKVEFECTELPMHFRSREELARPFTDPDSAVSHSGLVLVSIDANVVSYPPVQEREFDEPLSKGVTSLMKEKRAWQESSLLQGLSHSRSHKEKEDIINLFYERYFDLIRKDPLQHSPDFLQHCVVIRKRAALNR